MRLDDFDSSINVEDQRGGGGMGLGVFIATTLLERTGARLRFENGPHSGACVTATWPRPRLEQATDNKDTSHAA